MEGKLGRTIRRVDSNSENPNSIQDPERLVPGVLRMDFEKTPKQDPDNRDTDWGKQRNQNGNPWAQATGEAATVYNRLDARRPGNCNPANWRI